MHGVKRRRNFQLFSESKIPAAIYMVRPGAGKPAFSAGRVFPAGRAAAFAATGDAGVNTDAGYQAALKKLVKS